jgi:fatty acid desaturase
MSAELGSLRAELRAARVFEHRELRCWLELAALAAAHAACLLGLWWTGWVGAPLFIPAAAVTATSIAMLGHGGSHRSFSASPARNALLVYLVYPLFSGLGSLYWRNKHDRLHHGHPNVEGMDPDIKPFPFASSRGDHESCGRKQRWFQRSFQRYLFWPMATLMPTGMRRSSILYLWRYENKLERRWLIEVACMTAHYVGWLVIPSLVWGPLVAIALYSAIWGLVGVSLALIFAPAHVGLPIVTKQNEDWIHQLETTRNLELPRVISFFFIGLDYQVEHHLFPKIPHQNLPTAARITADWCRRNGIVYHSMPYLSALADSARFMADAWSRQAVSPESVRLAILEM